jgi:hypothetical protein
MKVRNLLSPNYLCKIHKMKLFSFSTMEKDNIGNEFGYNTEEDKKRYIMATILMPIEVRNLEEEDFVCLQERARVSLTFCKKLPEIAMEGEGYGGLSQKIHDLYDSSSSGEKEEEEEEKGEDKKGAIEDSIRNDLKMEEKTGEKKRTKKNITYRRFRENSISHRYTFKRW